MNKSVNDSGIEAIPWHALVSRKSSGTQGSRVIWWNLHRSSWSARSSAPRTKLIAQMEKLAELAPQAIGLSEVMESAIPVWHRFARELGYQISASKPSLAESGDRKCTVVLIDQKLSVGQSIHSRVTYNANAAVYYDYQSFVVDGLFPEPVTFGAVYNYGGGYTKIASKMARFAHRHSGGRVLVGGDWNLIRSSHGLAGPYAWADPAFDKLTTTTRWIEVAPTRADGTPGPVDSQPVWPVKSPSTPRQLDHVFADVESFNGIGRVSFDCDLQMSNGRWMSDHGMMIAEIVAEPGQPRDLAASAAGWFSRWRRIER